MHHPDVCIAGAGIIGLSLALELHHRGFRVTVLEKAAPLAEASIAAAGMLAAKDPHISPALRSLANLSLTLYPDYLDRLSSLSGIQVPFQTHTTIQKDTGKPRRLRNALDRADLDRLLPGNTLGKGHFYLLDERSLDPRQLATALLAAVHATSIHLQPNTPVLTTRSRDTLIEVQTPAGVLHASRFVDCTGAWATATSALSHIKVAPRKGQMLSVALPFSLPFVIRTPYIYIVPRTSGPHAGQAIIGATIEDAGFDKIVHPTDIAHLRTQASNLLPQLASARILESWAGLRPATADGLPLLGALPSRPNHFLATGHFRDGILLAPATAHLMAQLLSHQSPSLDLEPFSPSRAAPVRA
jgi:glycine oxidase